MINNRQAGRRRGRGGQQQRSQGNPGRPDNGNRIDNRARGNAAQLLEKYKSLARDAQMQGDRVNTEYYLQFADHYFRVLAETRSRFDENRRQNGYDGDDEQDYDDDGEPLRADEIQQNDRQQYDRQQGDRPQNDRQQRDRPQNDRQQNDRQQNDRQSGDRGNGYAQQNRGNGQYDENRGDGRDNREARNGGGEQRTDRYQRDDRGAGERPPRIERGPVHRDAPVPAEAEFTPFVSGEAEAAPAPRRRGRPPRAAAAPVEAPESFEADRLPPSLSISATAADADAEEKPRRRRGRPPASETTPIA